MSNLERLRERIRDLEEAALANQARADRAEALLAKATKGLRAAVDHLDFCGYGDTYERECADALKLPKRLDALLAKLEAAK